MKKAYSDNLNIALVFRIPVYKTCPNRPFRTRKPAAGTAGGPAWRHHAGALEHNVYDRLRYDHEIAEKTTASTLLKGLTVKDGYLRVVDRSGVEKSSKNVATGDVLQVLYKETRQVYKNYNIVIYGDVSRRRRLRYTGSAARAEAPSESPGPVRRLLYGLRREQGRDREHTGSAARAEAFARYYENRTVKGENHAEEMD